MSDLTTAEKRAAQAGRNQVVANHAPASNQGAASQPSTSDLAQDNDHIDYQAHDNSPPAAESSEPTSPASASAGTSTLEPSSLSLSRAAQAIQATTATLQNQINSLRSSLDAVQNSTINADTATLTATLSAGLAAFEQMVTGYQALVMTMDQRLTRLEVEILVRLPPLYASS
jgi:hypothetical protein